MLVLLISKMTSKLKDRFQIFFQFDVKGSLSLGKFETSTTFLADFLSNNIQKFITVWGPFQGARTEKYFSLKSSFICLLFTISKKISIR